MALRKGSATGAGGSAGIGPQVAGGAVVPQERARAGWIGAVSAANLGLLMAYFGPLAVLLPNQVQDVAGAAHKVIAFGWVSGLGAVVSVVANPLSGALSDRTPGRFGRRRPWVFGGAVVTTVSLFSLAGQHTVLGICLCWCLAQVGINATQAAVVASIPDRVPISQRGVVSGWVGVAQSLSAIVSVVLVSKVVAGNGGYLLLGLVTFALCLPFAWGVRDEPVSQAALGLAGLRDASRAVLRTLFVDPRRHPDFGWAWIIRFLMVLGDSVAVLYLLYFLRDRIHYQQLFPGQTAEDGLAVLLLVYTVFAVATTVVGGAISDRTGRRRIFVCVAGFVMAVPALLLAAWPTWHMTLAAACVLGIGFGVYLSVDQALVTQVLPDSAAHAKDLGVVSVANSAGQALAPALAAPVVTYLGGYRVLFLLVAGIVVLGSISVWRIRSVP